MNNSYNVENNGKGELDPSWWNRRSKMERKLTVFMIFAAAIILVLVIVIIFFFTRPSSTCLTPGCVHIANELLVNMNSSAKPCDDFYQFVCGNFLANAQLEDKPEIGIDTLMYENVDQRILGILEGPEEVEDPRSVILAKRLYRACLNQSAIEERGLKLIKDSLRQIGGWPALEGSNWKEKDFDWKAVTYKLRELGYGFEFFIPFRITPNAEDSNKYMLVLYKPYNLLVRATEEEEELYFQYMVNISVIFGADKARARNDFRDVIDFQKTLFREENEESEDNDKHNLLTVSELIFHFRDIPWLEYINRLLFPAPNITHDQIVSVTNTKYFEKLQGALKRTPKRILANYIAWLTVSQYASVLTSEVLELFNKYNILQSHRELPPRPKHCTRMINAIFPAAPLQAAYVRKHLTPRTKSHVTEILQDVKDEFKEVLDELKWMDDETRNKGLEKLATSTHYVAYPSDLMDVNKIEERYRGFVVDEDNFLSSLLNVKYYSTNLRFQKLHDPIQKDKELDQAYTTYAESYYSAEDNVITVPAGLLQGVIYDAERPQYLNYGSLGSILGHQVFHTVFEETGCRRETHHYDRISTSTLLKFNEKLSCVAMHYGKYPIPEIGEYLNSSNTKHEDIADIAGAELAYEAYKRWSRKNGQEQNLPGLEYNPKQLFWISSAIRFCKKASPAALESQLAHSYRSPNKFRALGILRNSKEFANDFNCPSGSYMNVEERCELW